MSESFTAVTCPECRTGQEIPHATPTRCICCGAEIDAVPGEYMTVIPNHAGQGASTAGRAALRQSR